MLVPLHLIALVPQHVVQVLSNLHLYKITELAVICPQIGFL